MFAVLGPISLTLVVSPESYTAERAYDYAVHRVVQAKPILQWVSDALEVLEFKFRFDLSFCNPGTQIAALRAAADQHLALPFVYGNGYHRGYFVVTKVGVGYEVMSDFGDLVSITVAVSLKEWIQDTSPSTTPPTQPAPAIQPNQPLQFIPGNSGTPQPQLQSSSLGDSFQPTTQPLPLSSDNGGLTATLTNSVAPVASPSVPYTSISTASIVRAAP